MRIEGIRMEILVGKETRAYLKKKGLPDRDLYELPESKLRFPDGAQYRLEVPTVNTAEAMRAVLETAEKYGVVINRIDETRGIMRHTDEELEEYIQIAKDFKVELNLSVGPRAAYDLSPQRATGTMEAGRIGYRLRGMEQVVRAVEDVKRAVELGCRGILVYDEGLLWLLNEMRKDGELPKDLSFKLSAHCGHGNPVSFKVLEMLGADSINPVRDLTLPMIAAIRQAVKVPIDVHVDNPASTGGMIRTYEAPEMVRVGAPIHLKTGNSVLERHGMLTTKEDGVKMAIQAVLVDRMIKRYYPEAVQSKKGAKGLAIPK
ncbi:MAG: peptidase [Candidatus Bathyarchaeia archaeon]